jgi:rod shape-determining protein MreD
VAVLIAFPILGGLLILQSAVSSQIPLLHGTTDLVFLAVAAWTLQKRVRSAWAWGIIGGLLVSYVSAMPTGVILAGYLLSIGLALLLKQRVWQVPVLAMLLTVLFGTLIIHLLSILTLRVLQVSIPLIEAINLVTLPSVLLNLLLAIPFYTLFGDLANWLYPEELEM